MLSLTASVTPASGQGLARRPARRVDVVGAAASAASRSTSVDPDRRRDRRRAIAPSESTPATDGRRRTAPLPLDAGLHRSTTRPASAHAVARVERGLLAGAGTPSIVVGVLGQERPVVGQAERGRPRSAAASCPCACCGRAGPAARRRSTGYKRIWSKVRSSHGSVEVRAERVAVPDLHRAPDELVAARALHAVDAQVGAADADGVLRRPGAGRVVLGRDEPVAGVERGGHRRAEVHVAQPEHEVARRRRRCGARRRRCRGR